MKRKRRKNGCLQDWMVSKIEMELRWYRSTTPYFPMRGEEKGLGLRRADGKSLGEWYHSIGAVPGDPRGSKKSNRFNCFEGCREALDAIDVIRDVCWLHGEGDAKEREWLEGRLRASQDEFMKTIERLKGQIDALRDDVEWYRSKAAPEKPAETAPAAEPAPLDAADVEIEIRKLLSDSGLSCN